MPSVLTFQLDPPPFPVDVALADNAGEWQYAGTGATEQTTGKKVTLVATKRVNSAPKFSPRASMLTAIVMFEGTENDAPEHLTIQGVHDLKSNNETGSVSAASCGYADYIGGSFSFDAAKLVLTINPRSQG